MPRNCTLPAHVPGGSCRGQSKTSVLPGQSRKGNELERPGQGKDCRARVGRGQRAGGRGSRRKDLGRHRRKNKPAKGHLELAEDWSKGKGGGKVEGGSVESGSQERGGNKNG